MKVKAWMVDIVLVIVVSFLFIFLYEGYEKAKTSSVLSIPKRFKIYLITIDKQDQYWKYVNQGAFDMAELLGVTYAWDAPETKNTEKQIEILRNTVDSGADAILIAVNDPIRTSAAIEDAKARNVKIVYVDTPAYEEAVVTLSTNNYNAGKIAGETMLAELEAVGIREGRIGIVNVNKDTESVMSRERGFIDVINQDGRFTLLPPTYDNGDPVASQKSAAGFIEEYKDLVGLFGTNEGSSIGVGNAIKEDNNRIIGIGFDITKASMELVDEGSLKAVIAQNPYTMGYLGIAEAVAALHGLDTGPSYLDTGVSVIRKR